LVFAVQNRSKNRLTTYTNLSRECLPEI
jgi:hypothetical protein